MQGLVPASALDPAHRSKGLKPDVVEQLTQYWSVSRVHCLGIPSNLCSFNRLEFLALDCSGPSLLPEFNFARLQRLCLVKLEREHLPTGHLPSLTFLRLEEPELADLVGLATMCPSLEDLEISIAKNLEDVSELKLCSSLTQLRLWQCHSLNRSSIQNARHIRKLCCQGCGDLGSVVGWDNLTEITVAPTAMCVSLPSMMSCPRLTSVNFLGRGEYDLGLGDALKKEWFCPRLRRVMLIGDLQDHVSSLPISSFPNLQTLVLFRGSNIKGLAACPSLTRLELRKCGDFDLAELANCKQLTQLRLTHCELKDLSPVFLCLGLTHLVIDLGITEEDTIRSLHRYLRNHGRLVCTRSLVKESWDYWMN